MDTWAGVDVGGKRKGFDVAVIVVPAGRWQRASATPPSSRYYALSGQGNWKVGGPGCCWTV
jgi:hypothetical protein